MSATPGATVPSPLTVGSDMTDIEALIEKAKAARPPGCWAKYLNGDAARFVQGIRSLVEGGTPVNVAKVREILKSELGIEIGRTALGTHLNRHCQCQK